MNVAIAPDSFLYKAYSHTRMQRCTLPQLSIICTLSIQPNASSNASSNASQCIVVTVGFLVALPYTSTIHSQAPLSMVVSYTTPHCTVLLLCVSCLAADVFNPRHKSASMRSRMSEGHPEAPLLVYVGRLGAEKNTEALKDILQQVRGQGGRGEEGRRESQGRGQEGKAMEGRQQEGATPWLRHCHSTLGEASCGRLWCTGSSLSLCSLEPTTCPGKIHGHNDTDRLRQTWGVTVM